MLRTPVIGEVATGIGIGCLVVLYNWAPHWTKRFYWLPKTMLGTILFLLVLWSAILVYGILVG